MKSFNTIFKPFDLKIDTLKSYCLNVMIFSDLSNQKLANEAR